METLNKPITIAGILFILFALIYNREEISNRFNYALDYELKVLTTDCTYETYKTNKHLCLK